VPGGMFVKQYPDDVFQEHNWHKHHICNKWEEYKSPYVDYIVVAIIYSLDDQTAHAKVCSIHCYEQKKLIEKMMTQSC